MYQYLCVTGSFEKYPEEFYRFYRDKLVIKNVKPNITHIRLAQLEAEGKLKAVITQNIDGLHQAAGSKNVLELHGSVHRCYCSSCGKSYDEDYINDGTGIPRCSCGGVVRPDVVLYEEGLDSQVLEKSVHYIRHADMVIVGGTSLVVYPAAGLLNYYKGNKLVLANRDATARDDSAQLVLRQNLGEIFSLV